MKKSEMIHRLNEIEGDPEITILDGFNAGGQPRTINFGPLLWVQEGHTFRGDPRQDYADIESKPGADIIIMGYGFY